MIDILLSTYNGERFLLEQLDSLFNQTCTDFKILIRDDGSKDGTLKIIDDYKKKYPDTIQIIENNGINLGSTNSFFTLLQHSTSELIMFCDQDDQWKRDKLEIFIDYYNKNILNKKQPILIHSAVEVVDFNLCTITDLTDIFNKEKCGMEKTLKWQILQNDVTGCTMMINSAMRDIINKIGFNDKLVIQHDWFIAQIAYLYGNKFYIPMQTIKYRQHSNNVLGAQQLSFLQRIHYKCKKGGAYPFYNQITKLLACKIPTTPEIEVLLKDFSALKEKNKLKRILWHITHNFFRDGNFLYKIYQIIVC